MDRVTVRRRPGSLITNAAREDVFARDAVWGHDGWIIFVATFIVLLLILLPRYDQKKTKLIDAYGYEFAIENFAHGRWLVSEADIEARLAELDKHSPFQLMVVAIGEGEWAFRKSPGYPLLVLPFQKLGLSRAANGVLLILAAGALYAALGAWRGKRFAFMGVLVFLFTPMTLRAAYFSTMDTFAAGSLPLIAASLLILYRYRLAGTAAAGPALVAAGLFGGWSVVTRIHNLPILLLLLVFALLCGRSTGQKRDSVAFAAGLIIPFSVLLIYNQAVFGRPLATGYTYDSPFQELFLWESNTLTEMHGQPLWHAAPSLQSLGETIIHHLLLWLEPLLRGWPLLPLALAALLASAFWRRFSTIFWLCILWIAATYALYAGIVYFGITYELSVPYFRGTGFFAVDRYLYPASFPITLLTTVFLASLRREHANLLLLFLVAAGLVNHALFVL